MWTRYVAGPSTVSNGTYPEFKVFGPVIVAYPVSMVNGFSADQRPTEELAHDDPVLKLPCGRTCPNEYVSVMPHNPIWRGRVLVSSG